MKVAIIVRSNKLSGAERRAIRLYDFMKHQRNDVVVEIWMSDGLKEIASATFPKMANDFISYENAPGLNKAVRIGVLRLFKNLKLIRRLWNRYRLRGLVGMVRDRKVDVAHVFLDPFIEDKLPCRSVFEVTSPDVADEINRRHEQICTVYDRLHCVSQSVFKRCVEVYPQHMLTVAEQPFFAPPEFTQEAKREKIITFAHRLIPRKNGVIFAESAKVFLRKHPDWQVFILGDGPEKPRIVDILRDEIERGLAHVDFVRDIASHLQRSSIFVSLIEPDNYPSQSILEALWSGNALVISETGDSVNKFYGNNGEVVQLTVDSVVSGLIALAADPAALRMKAQNSRMILPARFNPHTYTQSLIELVYDNGCER